MAPPEIGLQPTREELERTPGINAPDWDPDPWPKPIRMSSSGYCPRRQGYMSLGYAESDPADRQGRNRMALGDAAEAILVSNMRQDGWEIRHCLEEQLEIGRVDPPMTGHPDGICRHAEHTGNRWITLECKSMSENRRADVEAAGLAAIYPEYVVQACCYARILHSHDKVSEPRAAVFAYMDREGAMPAPELVQWDEKFEAYIRERLQQTWDIIREGELPARPYEPDNDKCEYCPFYRICHDQDPPNWRNKGPAVTLKDRDLVAAAEEWLEANERRKAAREILIEAVPYDRTSPDFLIGDAVVSWFIPSKHPEYDTAVLRTMLREDQLRQARYQERVEPAFWIREQRKRSD